MVRRGRKQHPEELRTLAIRRFRSCQNVAALAREIGIPPQTLYRWIDESKRIDVDEDGVSVPLIKDRESRLRKRIGQLKLGSSKQDIGSGFFQRRLAESQGSTPREQRRWRAGIYDHIRDVMSLQGCLSIERMCQLAGVSKAGFYRHLRSHDSYDEEMHVRSEIQNIALEHHGLYGYRHITAELRRRGMLVNHKRVARIMRGDDLLAAPARWPKRRRSRYAIQANLAAGMTRTGTNQLWVADITHVRLKREFVYLAVVLDRFSRRVVGWALDRTLTSRLPIGALARTLDERRPGLGLVHHSDRGPQYLHAGYLKMLRKHGIVPSVSRPGRPGDNANSESFFRTLKREEIYAKEYRDLDDLRISNPLQGANLFDLKKLQSLGRAFGSRPNARDMKRGSVVRKLLKGKLFRRNEPESGRPAIKM